MYMRNMRSKWIYCGILCLVFMCVYFMGNISTFLQQTMERKSTYYNCSMELSRLNSDKASQDDARLITAISMCFLEKPSRSPYNLINPGRQDYSQGGHKSTYLDNLLYQMRDGFFVECGAFDGERISNTLFFELYRSWTGLLIEPLPREFEIMREKNRKSYISNACLSKHAYPTQVSFKIKGTLSRIIENEAVSSRKSSDITETIQCFPLFSLLMAINRSQIDLLSLDIEGDELTVLKTIPWEKIDIKVLIVEHNSIKEGKRALINYMAANDYTNLPEIREKEWQDTVFVKNGFIYNRAFASSSVIKKET